jgi:hypothetical protein
MQKIIIFKIKTWIADSTASISFEIINHRVVGEVNYIQNSKTAI